MKRWLWLVVALAPWVWAQPASPLLPGKDAAELVNRSIQLMDAVAVSIPDMSRAGAPLIESARQAEANLKQRAGQSSFSYSFLTSLRGFVTLADAIAKPYPFAPEAARQISELRDNLVRFEAHFRAVLDQRETQLRGPDRDNLRRFSEANKTLAPAVAGKPRVVFYGDSITDFWRLNEYFPDAPFVNRGISGQITSEMLGRFKNDVVDLKPDAVVILAGTNDLARGVSIPSITSYYTMMADLADLHKIKMIWSSVLPVSDYHKDQNPAWEMTRIRPPAQIRALNDWLKSFCAQRGYTYLDYYTPMVDSAGMLQADLADDGLHPNSAGYRIMAPLALEAIQRVTGSNAGQTTVKPKKKGLFSRGQAED